MSAAKVMKSVSPSPSVSMATSTSRVDVGRRAERLRGREDQQPVGWLQPRDLPRERLDAEIGQVGDLGIERVAGRIGQQPGVDVGRPGVHAGVAHRDRRVGARSGVGDAGRGFGCSDSGTGTNKNVIRSGSTPPRSARGTGHDQAVERDELAAVIGARARQPGHIGAAQPDPDGDGLVSARA